MLMILKINKKTTQKHVLLTLYFRSEDKNKMDEKVSLKEFLQDYFGDNFKIISYLKNSKTGKDYVANIECNIKCQKGT